jgi:hypothetical protein
LCGPGGRSIWVARAAASCASLHRLDLRRARSDLNRKHG